MKSVPPLTPKTITQPDRLLKELESARINGYAMDDGEVEQGLICVAAPVRDASGREHCRTGLSNGAGYGNDDP